MSAKSTYKKLKLLAKDGELTIRVDINDFNKTLVYNGQHFVGHDKVEVFINKENNPSYKVWHFLSNDKNYEYLEVEDIDNKQQWVFEDKKV